MANKPSAEQKKPEKNFRLGAVGCAVWKNYSKKDNRPFFTISAVSRVYYEGKEPKNTTTLRVSDLPDAIIVLQKAYQYAKKEAKELNAEMNEAKDDDEGDEEDDEE